MSSCAFVLNLFNLNNYDYILWGSPEGSAEDTVENETQGGAQVVLKPLKEYPRGLNESTHLPGRNSARGLKDLLKTNLEKNWFNDDF